MSPALNYSIHLITLFSFLFGRFAKKRITRLIAIQSFPYPYGYSKNGQRNIGRLPNPTCNDLHYLQSQNVIFLPCVSHCLSSNCRKMAKEILAGHPFSARWILMTVSREKFDDAVKCARIWLWISPLSTSGNYIALQVLFTDGPIKTCSMAGA
jgi:hypothetical protein